MKNIIRFISVFLLFTSPIIIYYTGRSLWLLKDDKYKSRINGNEIYKAIEKSKKKNTYRKLILGDSTANQFYNCKGSDPDSAYSLSCNQAIGMVGQYILLNNYLTAGNRPDSVFILYTPASFWNNLDQIFTYHYFLKPFYYDEYKPLMTQKVIEQIHKLPMYWLCHVPYILTTAWAPNIQLEQRDYTFLSPISAEYLSKIDSLGKQYSFDLEIVPTFVPEHWRDSISHFNHSEFASYSYGKKMSKYLNNIQYLPDSCFVDEVHLRSPQHYKPLIDRLLNLH